MPVAIIDLSRLKAAATFCANNRINRFSRRRVTSAFDWIPERKRFAFGREI